jgi:hypothetical protein
MIFRFVLALLGFTVPTFAALAPHAIPRESHHRYFTEGLFEGGSDLRANLEGLRFSSHPREGFERWVFDFSDAGRRTDVKAAPRFRLRYVPGERISLPDGRKIQSHPARFVLSLRGIDRCTLSDRMVDRLAEKSHFVERVVLYPPIEEGDRVVEFVLREDVLFEPFQPARLEGRLVLDLRKAIYP